MKKVKQILISGILSMMAFCMITVVSCKKDACATVSCDNGGSCGGGICDCPSGYSGDKCQTPQNKTISGTYSGTDCSGNVSTITINALGGSAYSISMPIASSGSCPINTTLYGTLDANDNFSFPLTNVATSCGNIIGFGATGSFSGISLNMSMSVVYNGTATFCTFAGTKL